MIVNEKQALHNCMPH